MKKIKKLLLDDLKDLHDNSVTGGPYFKDNIARDKVLMNKINEIIDSLSPKGKGKRNQSN